MPRYYVTDNGFTDPDAYVDVADAPAGNLASSQLMFHPKYPDNGAGIELLPQNTQRLCFIGFADRDYAAGEVFEHRWALADGGQAVDVVFAEVGLCKQVNPFSFDPATPVIFNVVAARDVSAQIVVAGQYTAVLEVSTIPEPQTISRGDPLWIVWSVNCADAPAGTQPTFIANATDDLSPLHAEGLNVAWIPSNEIGAPASSFAITAEAIIRGLTRPPIP